VGETEFDDVWLNLSRVLDREYRSMHIQRTFVDSGYRPGDKWRKPDNQVYEFCMRMAGVAFPTKGHDTQDRPIKASMIDVNSAGRTLKNGLQLWHLNSDYLKSWVHTRIRWPEDADSGGFHLHADTDEDYCRQLVAEEVVVTSSGKRMWKKTAEDNHYLDCEAMCLAAAMSLEMRSLQPMKHQQQSNADSAPQAPTAAAPVSSPFRRRGMGRR
jgi:phage terminase large subunit GpA-like protein